MLILCVFMYVCMWPRDFIRYVLMPVRQTEYMCVCMKNGFFVPKYLLCLWKQIWYVCIYAWGIDVCECQNLLFMLGRYSGIGVALRGRIAPLLTEQSTSCLLYKQTAYSDQYGYQTHPTVVCTCVCVCVRRSRSVCVFESKKFCFNLKQYTTAKLTVFHSSS